MIIIVVVSSKLCSSSLEQIVVPIIILNKMYRVAQKLPQIYAANHATFPIRKRKITVQICGNFWVTQYLYQKTLRMCGLNHIV